MKVTFFFIFSRKPLYELKMLPCCHFMLWVYSYVQCHCDCRLGVFNLLINDWIKFQNYEEFGPLKANTQFIRVYNTIPDRDVFQNVNEYPEELVERVNLFSDFHSKL